MFLAMDCCVVGLVFGWSADCLVWWLIVAVFIVALCFVV